MMGRLLRWLRPDELSIPGATGNPDFDSYRQWWLDNAPWWNRYNRHDYVIGLVAWLDSRYYWQAKETA